MSDRHKTVQYQLRLPEKLREKIRISGQENDRSMNADIIARLEQSFATEEQARPLIAADAGWLEEIGVSGDEFAKAMKAIIRNGIDNLERNIDEKRELNGKATNHEIDL
ncbi:hypothetical protein CYJ96_04615 [Moraxella osloensis]|uniref:Arc-like DNA binding domain-containing protein n=1 Tax=Faucicola osloensis TaxID=34062 RepID=A0A2I1RIY0_FAUOS|nr:Arc family DNA-binding protein [Moraxella osloensis]PKZ69082.1 hypothetical protein CYJ96_04615 [Moraxella osloensis]